MDIYFEEKFMQLMEEKNLDTVVLMGHINPDGDAVGSVMGLAHYIKVNYPQYKVFPYLGKNMDILFIGRDRKRTGLLIMERAQPEVGTALF